jgi:hypothetical protein
MLLRCIAPSWLLEETPGIRKVVEGDFTEEQWQSLNTQGYNIYFLPNAPSDYEPGTNVQGSHIDSFRYVFVDMDLKEKYYSSKSSFLDKLQTIGIPPSSVVDSGNGVHSYWEVSDLDAMSYLRLSRRFMRILKTDEAVGQIFQLMRSPGSINTKERDNPKPCELLQSSGPIYTCEQLDALLPPITPEDEEYCKQHYNKTYCLNNNNIKVDDVMPVKFPKLVRENREVKDIWSGKVDDRSKGDYRLGHIMFANGFTKAEAMSVLVNSPKALSRTPVHRVGYAQGIVDKIWTFEELGGNLDLSESVESILASNDSESLKGKRFPCYKYFDGTAHGFRLGQVIGLCAGVGVGKTAVALNMFRGFVQFNPGEIHMFVSLEQPGREIAERWKKMCGEDTRLHSKVHILSNYNADGTYRHLSLHEIQDYIMDFQKRTNQKVGCVCIDHIGILKKETRNGENQGLMDVCSDMKSFAIATNTLLIMQSQTSREKAGIGDIELDKDCAYGTQHFESYVDFLVAVWQPLKRVYDKPGCPLVTAYKFCKIRFKSNGKDEILEDVRYRLVFDGETGNFREFKQGEEKNFKHYDSIARMARKKDRKTDEIIYTTLGNKDGKPSSNEDLEGDAAASGAPR